jgi:hypothetical protein
VASTLPQAAGFGVFFNMPHDLSFVDMARRLHNWGYREVTDFLQEMGFSFHREAGGSHQAWIKRGENTEPDTIVGVNFTHTSYSIKALERMIRQSGIDAGEWIKWSGS